LKFIKLRSKFYLKINILDHVLKIIDEIIDFLLAYYNKKIIFAKNKHR